MAEAAEGERRIFSLDEIQTHNTMKDCWIILGPVGNKMVYDVTSYLQDHPGGPEILLEQAGKDAEDLFQDIGHSKYAVSLLKKYVIGKFDESSSARRKSKEGENGNCSVS